MQLTRFSALSVAIQMLAYSFQSSALTNPGNHFDNDGYNKAIRAAQRRHDRFYGCTSKYKPRAMQVGSRPALRYAARIAAGQIPKAEILRAA